MRFVTFCLPLVLLAGCTQKTPDQLLQMAVDGEQAVHQLHAAKEAKAARKAAKEAWAAAGKLDSLARRSTNDVALAEKAGRAMTHARAARDEADLAMNEWEYSRGMNGLKAKAYRKARGVICTGLLSTLADAADAAATNDPSSLPPLKRELCEAAQKVVEMAHLGGGTEATTNDWKRVAGELRSYSTNQPPSFSAALACGYLGLGQMDLALVEMESIPKDQLQSTNDFLLYHGGRCLIYLSRGWTQLAGPEVTALGQYLNTGETINGRTAGSLYHAYLALDAASKHDLVLVDSELAQAVQAWPANPWLSFVTGEQLAANGRWEEAAESLEKEARGTTNEWAAKRMAQRARDLRDGKGNCKSLVLDARFLLGFASEWATTSGRDSAVGKRIVQVFDSGNALARLALSKLPFADSEKTSGKAGSTAEP